MSAYRRLLSYVKPHQKILAGAFLCMFATSLFEASPLALVIPLVDRIMADKLIVIPDYHNVPMFITDMVDKVNTMPRLIILNTLIVVAIFMAILRSIFEYAYSYLMNKVGHGVIRDFRSEIYRKIIHLPQSFYGGTQTGTLVSRITYDTGVIRDAISEGLNDLLLQPIQLVSYLAVLLVVRWVFAVPWSFIAIIAFVLPIVVYPIIKLGKRLKKISRQSQERMADIHTSLFETIGGIRIVQAFNAQKFERKKFGAFNKNYYKTMMTAISRTLLVRPMSAIVVTLCGGAVAWIGGRAIVYDGMSPGALLAFLAALFSLFRPFKRLSRLHSINQTAIAAAERIFEVLDTDESIREIENPVYIGRLKNEIHFQNITFGYHPANLVLKGVDLTVRRGEVVAIVGASGAGKTTLVNLLPRFYDASSGDVLIDGVSVKNMSLKSLRNQIGIVTQETFLFNETIGANIAYGQMDASEAAIRDAAQVANAHRFIMNMPDGYRTVVGDRGFRLSGGEKQRISIARAVFKNPPILILDEATSALDSESELLVRDAIHNLMQGRTVLVIAHRLSTVKTASRIVVLDKGVIREEGNHEELLQKEGLYKKIHDLQFQL